jgi:hypothetical protein
MSSKNFVVMIGVVALLAGALFGVMLNTPSVQAGPMAAPTPVASINQSTQAASEVTWMSGVATTASGGSTAVLVTNWDYADLQYVIDQTDVNTVTLKLQFSNDNVNWTDGATLVTDNAADAAALAQHAIFGKWARVYATVTNTNPVTVTVNAILK